MMRKHLKFIHEDSSDEEETTTPEQRMAKKYFRKLYREYCLCEMSGYREGRIGMRWRTEEEVLSGKGLASVRVAHSIAHSPLLLIHLDPVDGVYRTVHLWELGLRCRGELGKTAKEEKKKEPRQ